MKVRTLNDAVSFVRQFADPSAGAILEGYRRVRINAGDGSVRFECGTFDQGGNVTVDAEGIFGGFNEIEINIHELYEYLRALPAESDLTTAIDGGFFVIKCGRARKKFEIHFQKEAFRQAPMQSEWLPLYDGFADDLRLLNKLKLKGEVTLVSGEGYLYYRDMHPMNLLLIKRDDLPTFQLMHKFVGKILSCAPTHIAVDPNRVGFKNESKRMFAPLTVSRAPMVDKAVETILSKMAPEPITLDATGLRDACRVMATEWNGTDMLFVFLNESEDGVSMSCGKGNKTSFTLNGHIPKDMNIGVNYIATQNIADIGFGDPVSIGVTSDRNTICLKSDNLTYISSLRR